MLNYIGGLFSKEFFLSSQTRVQLSSRTVSILHSLTNHVDVTVYYDRDDKMYSTIMALLDEYHRIDPRINVKVVDYERDPAEAAVITQKYHLPAQGLHPDKPPAKNLIIFDCEGRSKLLPGDSLVQLGPKGMKDKEIEFGPVAFRGEMAFTATLLAVTNPKPFTAYYLLGQGEPSPGDGGDNGYSKFDAILEENYIRLLPLMSLAGGGVPPDCKLLIIAGPRQRFSDTELAKIEHYISQGGSALVMLDYFSITQPTGLEDLLADDYDVNVGAEVVQDRTSPVEDAVVVVNFNSKQAVVNPLMDSKLEMILPRPVGPKMDPNAPPDAPTVTWLAASSEDSFLSVERGAQPRSYPLMVAVEGNSANKGAPNPVANVRMIVIGDDMFLNNKFIEGGANRDFAGYAVNWLLDRGPMLLQGIGPRPVVEYRLMITKTQLRNVRWLVIGAFPAAVLALGGLVWVRRRK